MTCTKLLHRGVVSVLALAMLVSCGSNDADINSGADARACPVADIADLTEITAARAELLLGFGEQAAQACALSLGWAFRVGARNGESFPLTMDYSLQRVTVVVMEDRVTQISVG